MHHIHALIVDLTLITIYAGITTLICKKLKQPIVLGYVVAGILAGPFFNLLPTVSDRQYALLQAEGVVFTAEEKVDMALCRWTQEEAEESLWW